MYSQVLQSLTEWHLGRNFIKVCDGVVWTEQRQYFLSCPPLLLDLFSPPALGKLYFFRQAS